LIGYVQDPGRDSADEIVKRHDGKITAESEKGKGSKFIVSFPLQE